MRYGGALTAQVYGGELSVITNAVISVEGNGLQFGDGTFIEFGDGSPVEAPNA